MASIGPTQANVQTALKTFLETVLPHDVEIIAGVVNRVAEPRRSRFVTMVPLRMKRLRTNIDSDEDVKFIGSITGKLLTVSAIDFGTIAVGSTIFGTGVTPARIRGQNGGDPGGAGEYRLSGDDQTVASVLMSAGQRQLEQGTEVTVQLDFHSADNTAADLAQIASTTLRDPYGVEVFAATGLGVVPLHSDDPRYMPFINENAQYEWRWVLECCLQCNQTVQISQQYMDALSVDLVSVDVAFPPA